MAKIQKFKKWITSAALAVIILGLSACAGNAPSPAEDNSEGTVSGANVYTKYCTSCHGSDGKLQLNGAFDLSVSALSLDERVAVIANGRKLMTSYSGILSAAEIEAVAQYTMTLGK